MKDKLLMKYLKQEKIRQKNTIELIASENFVSKDVEKFVGSILTNKYAEGYPGKRYYGGCMHIDSIESLAQQRLIDIFKEDAAESRAYLNTRLFCFQLDGSLFYCLSIRYQSIQCKCQSTKSNNSFCFHWYNI